MFCTTCSGLLIPQKTPYGKWMSCPEGHPQAELCQDVEATVEENTQQMEKITASDGVNILAVHDHVCKKCGHGKAEIRDIGASYGDEDNVVRMKCGNCGLVEQLEGKVT